MIIEPYEQHSEDWVRAHGGIPTASQFGRILTPTGKPSDQAVKYMYELLAFDLTEKYESSGSTMWMEHGTNTEPEARLYYQLLTDREVTQVGFIYKDERKLVGCSPDGLVDAINGGLEIKCPKASTHVSYMLAQDMPTVYIPQVQGSMWITGRENWDWLSYHPDMPPVLLRVLRDNQYIAKLDTAVNCFIEQLLERREQLRSYK